MKIFYENKLKEIKNIIQNKAKFQKVMLLYDENISNLEKSKIYNEIRELCIYNEMNINSIDEEEIFNGYKAIIYLCSTNSFVKCNLSRDEFINIYCPIDEFMLPYFISNENKIDDGNNCLILKSSKVDVLMIISIYFNRFYNYLNEMLMNGNKELDFALDLKEITVYNTIECLKNFSENTYFIDLDILKKTEMDYEDIALLDLMLINSFYVLISSIKNNTMMLVDSYKCAKDDDDLLNKIYRIYNDETFKNLVLLNYNFLYSLLNKTKRKMLEFINIININVDDVENKIDKLKEYSKQSDNLITYLYVFNIFKE